MVQEAQQRPSKYNLNPNSVSVEQLEETVHKQIQSQSWNLADALALLRQYSFQPNQFNSTMASTILLQAQACQTSHDYQMCISLVPERCLRQSEQLMNVISLADQLYQCKYPEFWQSLQDKKALIDTVPGYLNGVRGYITSMLEFTAQRIQKSALSEALNLQGKELDQLIQQKVKQDNWVVSKDKKTEILQLGKNEFNMATPRMRPQDAFKYERIAQAVGLSVYSGT